MPDDNETNLDDRVGYFGTRYDRVGGHHTIGVLFTDLGNEECTHTGTGSTPKRVSDLEPYIEDETPIHVTWLLSHLEGSQCPQPLSAPRQVQRQPAQHPQCSL